MEEMQNKIIKFKAILEKDNLDESLRKSIEQKIKALESKIHILK